MIEERLAREVATLRARVSALERQEFSIQRLEVTLANDGVGAVSNTAAALGWCFISCVTEGNHALYALNGGAHSTTELHDNTGVFTGTKDTASCHNVYWSTTNSRYELQNKRGGDRMYYIYLLST